MTENEKRVDVLATVMSNEVCTYLKNTRCVNKMDVRTQLALRVLSIIEKFEEETLTVLSSSSELTEEDKKAVSEKTNALREKVYNSLKEY